MLHNIIAGVIRNNLKKSVLYSIQNIGARGVHKIYVSDGVSLFIAEEHHHVVNGTLDISCRESDVEMIVLAGSIDCISYKETEDSSKGSLWYKSSSDGSKTSVRLVEYGISIASPSNHIKIPGNVIMDFKVKKGEPAVWLWINHDIRGTSSSLYSKSMIDYDQPDKIYAQKMQDSFHRELLLKFLQPSFKKPYLLCSHS